LWQSVLGDFELSEPELCLLREAARTADVCDQLQQLVHEDGPMVEGRANPALVELRMQRILLARLLVALRLPLGEAEDEQPGRLQRRSVRGVYGLKGSVA